MTDDDRPLIILSQKWLNTSFDVGAARYENAVVNGYEHYGEADDAEESHHVVGAVGECATGKHYRLPWTPIIGDIHQTDVAGILEVRARREWGTGLDLAIRPKDAEEKPYKPFVLVWVYRDWSVRLIGWKYAKEGLCGTWCKKKGVWFNPPPYRSIAYLETLIREENLVMPTNGNEELKGDVQLSTAIMGEQTLAVDLARAEIDQAIATAHRYPRVIDTVIKRSRRWPAITRQRRRNASTACRVAASRSSARQSASLMWWRKPGAIARTPRASSISIARRR